MTALLTIKDLVKTYGTGETETRVLKGLDLQLEQGELSALAGPSGSGKSTLLTILGTLMKPTSGTYSMLGVDMVAADDRALTAFRNLHIGFVFQFHNLLPDFTALENVIFPTAVREGRETPAARARGRDLLIRMGLAERVDFPATNLSGGQKQRVAVARALVASPALVLADEPTAALDKDSAGEVVDLLKRMGEARGTTTLLVTHDNRILDRADRILTLEDGRIVKIEERR